MDRLKTLTKPLIALLVVIVFAWLVVVTRYQYLPTVDSYYGYNYYTRIDRLTGKMEVRVNGIGEKDPELVKRWMEDYKHFDTKWITTDTLLMEILK